MNLSLLYMNKQRLYDNIMKDLKRVFRNSLNEDILDDIDIDSDEEDITTKMHKQIRSEIIYNLVQDLINHRKKLLNDFIDINKDVAVW